MTPLTYTPPVSGWTLGVYLTLDRRRHMWAHATRDQIDGVCGEPMPVCCADVRAVCARHGLSEEATAAVVDVWEVWEC